jgi:hypothetical protein
MQQRHWTPHDDDILRQAAIAGRPVVEMARGLGRTEDAVRMRAAKLGISLKRLKASPRIERTE